MENQLEATGERFIPADDAEAEIRLEHLSRYHLARELACGKDVLDVASGEGYGSNLLAETANRVWGVDISQEAVDHAVRSYSRSNLRFLRGDASKLPLPDHSVDLVVSFETIEHLSGQQEMIGEIRRVLRPGGRLLISSPDRENYDAIQHGGQNHFHVRELSGEEFAELLRRNFSNVRFARQNLFYSSMILWEDGGSGAACWDLNGEASAGYGNAMPALYWLALASDGELETPCNVLMKAEVEAAAAFRNLKRDWEAHMTSVQADYQEYIRNIQRDYKANEESLRRELENLDAAWSRRLASEQAEWKALTEKFHAKDAETGSCIESLSRNLEELKEEFKQSTEQFLRYLSRQERHIDELSQERRCLKEQLDALAGNMKSREEEIADLLRQKSRLQEQFDALAGNMKSREEEIADLLRQKSRLQEQFDALAGNMKSREEEIADLFRQRSRLQEQLEQEAARMDALRKDFEENDERVHADFGQYVAHLQKELKGTQARASFFQRRYYLLTHPHAAFGRMCVKLVKRPVLGVSGIFYSGLRGGAGTWKEKIRKGLVFVPKHLFPRQYAGLKSHILKPGPSEVPEPPAECPRDSRYTPPLVTVIVPNYNHAAFLPDRLESIYNQTYQNIEVLLLDDCSSDGSREILQRYADQHSANTRILFNEKNSGSPFAQWKKGIAHAGGDLIWIAESDDWCDLDFLEKLVCAFSDESVMLAFARSVFVKNGETVWTHEEYLHRYGMERWRTNFVVPAHSIVNDCFGSINIVPNVSSAVFRAPAADFPLWDDEEWSRMRVCGDWVFYLHLIRGGKIAYFGRVSNYYRQHENNTSVTAQQKDLYYAEHVILTRHVLQNYRMEEGYEQKQKENLRNFWTSTRGPCSDEEFNSVCRWDEAFRARAERKPNVFMFLYAFSSGGGEVFPIHLANELKRSGYGITLVNCELSETLPQMRRMVHRGIPVLNLRGNYEIGNAGEAFGAEILHTHHASVDFAITTLHGLFPYAKHVVTTHGMYETMHPQDIVRNLPVQMEETACWCYIADKNLKPLQDYLRPETFLRKLPNGLEIQEIQPVDRKTLGIPQNAFVFCLVSRGLPEKGWQEAIEAMQIAQQKSRRQLHLLLLGDGPMYEKLKNVALPNVHVLGFQPNVRDYFMASDMGLLPSRFSGESFPLVLIECLLSGRPAIASDLGEIRNILTDPETGRQAGLIFSLKDGGIPVAELAELMSRCVRDGALYRELCDAVPLAGSRVDITRVARQYGEVYAEVISGRR